MFFGAGYKTTLLTGAFDRTPREMRLGGGAHVRPAELQQVVAAGPETDNVLHHVLVVLHV